MDKTKVLDCTLRDGAYLVDKWFGASVINGIIDGLRKARIDYIEIGFLQNEGFGEGKTVFLNGKEAAKYVPKDKQDSMFTVLADYSRYDINNLDQNDGNTFDAVRACFFKHERYKVIDFCKAIKEKGYKVFVQPVDIMGYTDREIIELLEMVNPIEPYCLSIVDTFGSMYADDLQRIFYLIHNNLNYECKMGFHSHNNMQMSNALSQEFISLAMNKREVIVDSTLCGMGRGAGNTPTELVVQYLNDKLGYSYNMDALLDVIDIYMTNLKSRCTWGYSVPYFIAGCYSAHVNNVAYLQDKNSIRSKDIRFILNSIGAEKRKRYDYDLLEDMYLKRIETDIDDSAAMETLKKIFKDKNILLIAPGKNNVLQGDRIKSYIDKCEPLTIAINFMPKDIHSDILYFSNTKRYTACSMNKNFEEISKILTSNVKTDGGENEFIISFAKLIKCGWNHMDNSMILFLRLLDCFEPKEIAIAGFDGYDAQHPNYASVELEVNTENAVILNEEITSMLKDYMNCRNKHTPIITITDTRFSKIFEGESK